MKVKSDAYKKLLAKLDTVDMGTGGGFWKPPEGLSTIRILPPVGEMGYFFLEAGQHYVNNTSYMCPNLCSGGKDPCPLCEVNELLFRAGQKEQAGNYRVQRKFWMNVIVRGEEDNGPQRFTPGIKIAGTIFSYIQDPDYGDITDEEDGFDVKVTRNGTGLATKYETRLARNPSALGDDDQIEEWLESATDIVEYIATQLMSYEDMAEQTGVGLFLEEGDMSALEADEDESEDEVESPSAQIEKRLSRRSGRGGTRRKRTS